MTTVAEEFARDYLVVPSRCRGEWQWTDARNAWVYSEADSVEVRIVDDSIYGLVDGVVRASYDTSGVQLHKVEIVMADTEAAWRDQRVRLLAASSSGLAVW